MLLLYSHSGILLMQYEDLSPIFDPSCSDCSQYLSPGFEILELGQRCHCFLLLVLCPHLNGNEKEKTSGDT